ncbi:hypothetical protein Bca52824_004894 [Brassica carinata]|uniref:FBD domain-containing protein n=1 Tax=Brassica carinata TaxID=52824 RepID=A0A8X8BCN7_BRACI|nr:hypothetical protein Bca52824_004894 [Brassica carinata]
MERVELPQLHEHPLIPFNRFDFTRCELCLSADDYAIGKPYIYGGYRCNVLGCELVVLHKDCANPLKEINHSFHPDHPLKLIIPTFPLKDSQPHTCFCGNVFKVGYYCTICDFKLDLSVADSVKVDLDFEFVMISDYYSERKALYNHLHSFSRVGDVTMSWRSLQDLFLDYQWPRVSEFSTVRLPRCLVSSLESVEMESPVTEIAAELRLVGYFLENSTKLKKLVLRLNQSFTGEKHKPGVLEQLIDSPRRSSLCQFEVISTPNLRYKEAHYELLIHFPQVARLSTVRLRPCLVSSLESVEIESPVTEIATELDLARYFMKNSTTLKKLVLRLKQSSTGEKHKPGVLDQLIESPRRSSLCQFEVLPVVPTPNPWPEGVDIRKLERFQVDNKFGPDGNFDDFRRTPLTLSVCEALVCLKLHFVSLNEFESLSLPCLKIMYLEDVVLPSDAAAETLISSSPVLEILKICLSRDDFVVALRFRSFEITSKAESFKVDIDLEFSLMTDYSSQEKIINNLLNRFSGVKDMTISWRTLPFINWSHQTNPLPKFHGLTRLRATMCLNESPELLPVVLESCPNLKHLTLELLIHFPQVARLSTVRLRPCLVSSLESVEIESPVTEIATELDLARYFMKNSTTLKKLVLRLKQSSTGEKHKPGVLDQLIESPRRSSLCQFEVLPVVPTPNPWPEGLGVSSSSVQEGERVVIREEEDRISLLPEELLCHILSFLTTQQAVWASVLSSRWRHLWKWVPRLELDSFDFPTDKVCVDFINKFLAFQGKSFLREFKLTIDHDIFGSEASLYEPCVGRVDIRKLERFQVDNKFGPDGNFDDFRRTPLTLSVCEALTLISSSPVLEILKICLSRDDFVVALRVCSPSLKSFALKRVQLIYPRRHSVVIDAPKLEYLSLMDHYQFRSFEITSKAESFKVDIDLEFSLMTDYSSQEKIINNLLNRFSGVKDMTISWRTLPSIY